MSGKENRANVANVVITNSQNEKLLGIFFDKKPTFGYHIENVCLKASLAFVAPYTDLSKRKDFWWIRGLAIAILYGFVIAVH